MKRPRVLVADDDRHLRSALCARLRHWGFGVLEASDGLGAITGAAREHPVALILDQQMPLGEGSTVGRFIRRECNVPIVFISGCAPHSVLQDMLELPEVYFLPKPLDSDVLHRILERCVARRRDGSAVASSFN